MVSRRVGILGLQHESNTFSPLRTELREFTRAAGPDIESRWASSHSEVAGFFEGLRYEGIQALPLFMAVATPSGTVTANAYTRMMASIKDALDRALPLDGLLVAPHGAGVSTTEPDMDGAWLQMARKVVGADVPIVCTLDLHANVSERMVEACDATIAYRTNPHLDTFDRGVEAAALMGRALRGEVRLEQVGSWPPVAINILSQGTSAPPCSTLVEVMQEVRRRDRVLSASACLGFHFADVAEMGTSFIVVTDGDERLARALAGELAEYLVEHRHEFDPVHVTVDEAIDRAATIQGPVCLLDTGDNVGGGSAGDGTVLAQEIARRGGPPTFICLYEPGAVARLDKLEPGDRVHLALGGKHDALHGSPLELDVIVRSRHEGRFTEPEVRHGGETTFDMGATVVVETEVGLTLQLTSKRITPFSLNQLLSCDIDPAAFQIVVAKGVHAPTAAYEPVCSELIRVTTPGATNPDMSKLRFERVRRPLYPLDEL
jgi:microcystin degradation protein MlrC